MNTRFETQNITLACLEIPGDWQACDLQPAAHQALEEGRPQHPHLRRRRHEAAHEQAGSGHSRVQPRHGPSPTCQVQ